MTVLRYDDSSKEDRLFTAIETAYRRLRPYREGVVRLNEEYAGPFYGSERTTPSSSYSRQEKYINLLKQAVSAYMTMLASNRPRCLISTNKPELKAFARHFEIGMNRLFEEIKIENTLAQWVRDAFFWMGVVKVHMADTGQLVHETDMEMDPGMPFVSNVALDDFVYDINATKFSECRFAGDIYRMPLETVETSDIYDISKLEGGLEPAQDLATGDRLKNISMGYEANNDELEPMVDLCDLWLPREGKVRTYVVGTRDTLKLRGPHIAEYDWEGVELGPYKLLHFDEVSENVMPTSTASDLYPLDRLINNLMRKNSRKARRQKDTPIFSPSGQDSARKLRNASDGEWVAVNDPREVNVIKHGGIDGNIHGFMLNSMEIFDRMAGNLPQMLGLGASTDTVGQEKLVAAAGSRRMTQLQQRMQSATTCLAYDLGFLLWQDGYTELPSRYEIPGAGGAGYDTTWKPKDREGEYRDYDFSIDIYSMVSKGPAERINSINALIQGTFMPMMPIMQQQGGTIDVAKLTELYAEMMDLPRLNEVIVFDEAPETQEEGPDQRKPPTSTRNYTRTNKSAGDDSAVPQASEWMSQGGDQQPQT